MAFRDYLLNCPPQVWRRVSLKTGLSNINNQKKLYAFRGNKKQTKTLYLRSFVLELCVPDSMLRILRFSRGEMVMTTQEGPPREHQNVLDQNQYFQSVYRDLCSFFLLSQYCHINTTNRIQLVCRKTFFKKSSIQAWVHESGKNFPFITKRGKSEVDFLNILQTTANIPKVQNKIINTCVTVFQLLK